MSIATYGYLVITSRMIPISSSKLSAHTSLVTKLFAFMVQQIDALRLMRPLIFELFSRKANFGALRVEYDSGQDTVRVYISVPCFTRVDVTKEADVM